MSLIRILRLTLLLSLSSFAFAGADGPDAALFQQLGADIDGEAQGEDSGWSVSLSADGTVVAIGATSADGSGSNSGTVRLYSWDGAAWNQLGADIDGEAANDRSGYSVSLSADGTVVAIGARANDGNSGNPGHDSGHVRLYGWDGAAWNQLGADIDGEAANDRSGWSVSLSADGTVVAIGADYNAGNGIVAGHVRLYSWNGSNWAQRGSDIDGEAAEDFSGSSVSLSADGSVVAIGAPRNDGNGDRSGHVRLYGWDGAAWNQFGADIDGEAPYDESGSSVSLSADGTVVAIGAYSSGSDSGQVRLYGWDGAAWNQLGADIDGEAQGDASGWSVSLSADGTLVAIGARTNDGNGDRSGHVRLYGWDGAAWNQLGADIDGEAPGDRSGHSVSLSADGTVVAIGADMAANGGSGHVRVYRVDTDGDGVPVDIDGTAPSSYYDVASASDGRSILAFNTGSASGGPSKVLLQRFDTLGEVDGPMLEVQDSPNGSGPVHVEWLSNDSAAVTFFYYENGRYRVELRIVDVDNNLVYAGTVIGDSGTDYKPQDLVDLGDNKFLITWNYSPNHPQLPNQGGAAWVYDYQGSPIGLPFWLAQSATGSTESGRHVSVASATKLDDSRVVVAILDRSNGRENQYFTRTFNWTECVNANNNNGYCTAEPEQQENVLQTPFESRQNQFALLGVNRSGNGSSETRTTYGVEDFFDTSNGPEVAPISVGLQAHLGDAALAELDDVSTNKSRAFSFDLSGQMERITGAVLKIRARPLDDERGEGNDGIFLSGFDGAGNNLIPAYNIGLGIDSPPNNYFDFDWQIDGRPAHPAEGYELVIDLASFSSKEGVGLSLIDDMNATGLLDLVIGDDTNVDYVSLEITTSDVKGGYVVLINDSEKLDLTGSVFSADGDRQIGPKTLLTGLRSFTGPSMSANNGELSSLDVLWRREEGQAVLHRRFDSNLEPVSAANLHVFNSAGSVRLIPLSPEKLRAFTSASYDSAIEYRDLAVAPPTGPVDTDGDGVPDNIDAFINDPAASVDTDGDGKPDEWNDGKSAADSTSDPALVLDDDDDNDGVNDEDDVYPLDATLWSMKIEDALAGIADDNLRACVAEATSGKQQVSEVTELNCARRQVSALNGLSGLTNLTTLVLHDNQVTDVSELSGLINLTFLNLGNNRHGYFGVVWVNKSDLVEAR